MPFKKVKVNFILNVATMKTLGRWLKFLLLREANPIKGKRYLSQLFEIQDDIDDARQSGDWKRLSQYGCIFLIQIAALVHFIWLTQAGPMSELQSYIHANFVEWFHISKLFYVAIYTNILLTIYFLYLVYFSHGGRYVTNWQRKILLEKSEIQFDWPNHYRAKNCSVLIRKVFWVVLNASQSILFIFGKKCAFHFKTNS